MQSDCSDAVTRLGASSDTFDELQLATKIQRAFDEGLDTCIGGLQETIGQIESLPNAGVLAQLKLETGSEIENLKSRLSSVDFFEHGADFASALTSLKSAIAESAKSLEIETHKNIEQAQESLVQQPDWPLLTPARQSELLGQIDEFKITSASDINGIRGQLDASFSMQAKLNDVRNQIVAPTPEPVAQKLNDKLKLPARLDSMDDFSRLTQKVRAAEVKARSHAEFEIEIELED